MAQHYDFEIYAHPSIYVPKEEAPERKLKIYFSEPDAGITPNTGVVLLISGFSGHANSKVYKKMRSQFADNHNLVTIQCDYFGWEFMQSADEINFEEKDLQAYFSKDELKAISESATPTKTMAKLIQKIGKPITAYESLQETRSNFNDMSLMQAIDNISAVIAVLEIIKDNGLQINPNKVIAYGHSHGAYLAYLCNAFAPNLFSMIIDNSAWIFPRYLNEVRVTMHNFGNSVIKICFRYLAHSMDFDAEIISLESLYQKFTNSCNILCFHGTDDNLIPILQKKRFIRQVKNASLQEISKHSLNRTLFESSTHGLGADFLALFDYAMENLVSLPNQNTFAGGTIVYQTNTGKYSFDYTKGLPILTIE